MNITLRRYKLLSDFERINEFIRQNFQRYQLGGNIPQPFWEYAHTHPYFNHRLTHRSGIWEDNGEIVAVACYELDLGECYFLTKTGCEYMKPGMIDYAEQELFKAANHQKSLDIYVFDYEA
ncbi:hypothetical protein [Paenibacillus caui]|uniref:hypothetical protein n=1 Tax=Paenibacillus caui TaxID=2873927 RepID=UPI001CA936D0|nr:hypothetical protein [Paenibacillus caui]